MTINELKHSMSIPGVRAIRVAALLGMHGTMLCKILSGTRPKPRNFVVRASNAVDLLEVAHRRAEEARARVLKTWAAIDKRYK